MRRLAHEMTAIYFGRIPHGPGLVVGGVTQGPTADNIALYRQKLTVLRDFIDNTYIPDVIAVAEAYADHFGQGFGCGNVLSYGVFDLDSTADLTKRKRFIPQGTANAQLKLAAMDPKSITEDVKYSRFSNPSAVYPGDGDTQDDVDRSFRQTGLQENKWRFSGVNRFRYYGELLSPELANLGIATVALGIPMLKNSSLELVYHRYRQAKAADFLRDARIDDGLTGISRDVGREIDLVLGFRESRRWELELIAGSFEAGDAFGAASGKRAYGASFELTLNF